MARRAERAWMKGRGETLWLAEDESWHNSIIACGDRAPVSDFFSVDFFEGVAVRARTQVSMDLWK